MTNLLSQVTPHTKGLLWLTIGEVTSEKPLYKDVDYLLNGLLTATLNSATAGQSHVLVSENFGSPFYVMIGSEFKDSEVTSFFGLIKSQMTEGSDIVLLDENDMFAKFSHLVPAEIKKGSFRSL